MRWLQLSAFTVQTSLCVVAARDEVRLAGRPHEEKMVSLCYVVWLESVSCFVRVGWVRPIWHA